MARRPRGSSGWAGAVGSQSWARGRILIFRKIHLYVFFAKPTHEKNAYPIPTLELPWSHLIYPAYPPPSPEEDEEARGRGEQREKAEEKKRKEKNEKKRAKWKWKNTYPRAELRRPKARPSQSPSRFAFPSSPLRRPSRGRSVTLGKSRRRTAYPQQIVTTRLLYCLQDRFAQLSRLQRI